MRKIRMVATALLAVLAGVASRPAAAVDPVDVRLRSFEEVPAISSPASGRFRAVIDAGAGRIDYQLEYTGLTGAVRQAHIHVGQRSVNGGISVYLCQTALNPDPTGLAPTCPASGAVQGTLTAANVIGPAGQGVATGEFAELVAAMRGGVAYINVHSSTFPGGEVRGQLTGGRDSFD